MRYVLLIYGSEDDVAGMTGEERVALMQGHPMFANEAMTRGCSLVLFTGSVQEPSLDPVKPGFLHGNRL